MTTPYLFFIFLVKINLVISFLVEVKTSINVRNDQTKYTNFRGDAIKIDIDIPNNVINETRYENNSSEDYENIRVASGKKGIDLQSKNDVANDSNAFLNNTIISSEKDNEATNEKEDNSYPKFNHSAISKNTKYNNETFLKEEMAHNVVTANEVLTNIVDEDKETSEIVWASDINNKKDIIDIMTSNLPTTIPYVDEYVTKWIDTSNHNFKHSPKTLENSDQDSEFDYSKILFKDEISKILNGTDSDEHAIHSHVFGKITTEVNWSSDTENNEDVPHTIIQLAYPDKKNSQLSKKSLDSSEQSNEFEYGKTMLKEEMANLLDELNLDDHSTPTKENTEAPSTSNLAGKKGNNFNNTSSHLFKEKTHPDKNITQEEGITYPKVNSSTDTIKISDSNEDIGNNQTITKDEEIENVVAHETANAKVNVSANSLQLEKMEEDNNNALEINDSDNTSEEYNANFLHDLNPHDYLTHISDSSNHDSVSSHTISEQNYLAESKDTNYAIPEKGINSKESVKFVLSRPDYLHNIKHPGIDSRDNFTGNLELVTVSSLNTLDSFIDQNHKEQSRAEAVPNQDAPVIQNSDENYQDDYSVIKLNKQDHKNVNLRRKLFGKNSQLYKSAKVPHHRKISSASFSTEMKYGVVPPTTKYFV